MKLSFAPSKGNTCAKFSSCESFPDTNYPVSRRQAAMAEKACPVAKSVVLFE